MEQFLALKASAGSGKTFTLTVRYISLLFLDVTPNTILTLTFTNKAALEMSERIFSTLINLGKDEVILEAISMQTNISIEDILEKKDGVIKTFLASELSIFTLDKFMNKILREFCGYIDISDDFNIENDDYDLMLYKFLINLNEQQFNKLIHFSYDNEKKLNSIIELFMLLDEKNENFSINEFSYEVLNDLKNNILQHGYKIAEFILNSDASKSAKNAVIFNDINGLLKSGKTWLTKDSLMEYSYFKTDHKPIDEKCECYTCKNFTRGYLNHLYRANEMTYFRLASIHNLHYYLNLMREAREAILNNNWVQFKKDFYLLRGK
jgi:exodeoxyribonuclease V beta subunit